MIKVAIALGLAIVFASLGDILLSKGMQKNGEVNVRRVRDVAGVVQARVLDPRDTARHSLYGRVLRVLYGIACVGGRECGQPADCAELPDHVVYAAAVMRERVSA